VTLATEEVTVYLAPTYAEVKASLTLHNPGSALSLPIGFPQDQPRPDSPADASGLEDVRAAVDGEALPVSFLSYADGVRSPGFGGWHTVVVPFDEGQTRVLEAEYRARNSLLDGDESYFRYVLSTSATWPDSIDAVSVTVHLTDTLTWDHLLGTGSSSPAPGTETLAARIAPGGYERSGNRIAWHWYQVEPDQGHNLSLAFTRQPVRGRGPAEAVLAPREPEPEPAAASLPGWFPIGVLLVVGLVAAGLIGRRRKDPLRLDF
jgi:hypothetical protein